MQISDYYKNQDVRARIIEYLGGSSLEQATCVCFTTNTSGRHSDTISPAQLDYFLNNGMEVVPLLWEPT